MPYIPAEARRQNADLILRLSARITCPGDFNWIICALYCGVAQDSYTDKSRWLAAVRDAADEIYRRDLAPYEDRKAQDNGDLPWPVIAQAKDQSAEGVGP